MKMGVYSLSKKKEVGVRWEIIEKGWRNIILIKKCI